MNEKLVKLTIPPGLVRAGTVYETQGRWYDGNLVRFHQGDKRPIGGWLRMRDAVGADLAALTGIPRALLTSRLDDGTAIVAVSTTQKFYIVYGGTVYDDTPVGWTNGDVNGSFASGGNYGDGNYGAGVYGGSVGSVFNDATTYQLDTFGQSVVLTDTKNKKLYIWAGTPGTNAAEAAGAPSSVVSAVVTPERFLMALGAGGVSRRVQWASQETSTTWTPGVGNSAGDFDLSTNGKIMAGRRTKQETLIWTDADLWAARYIGGDFIYSFQQVGDHCGLIAPNAGIVIDTHAFWMGRRSFFAYDGYVKPIPCEVSDYVFGDMNELQAAKIWAMGIPEYGEVWWFYPSSVASEIDRYVSYSYQEGHWSFGRLVRLCGRASGATTSPIMADAGGLLWEHEVGNARDSLSPYLESGPSELGEGDHLVKVMKYIPDEKTLGDVTITFYHQMYPMGTETTSGPHTASQPTDLRFTARMVRVRLSESRQTGWRVGTPRLGVLPGSKR